MSATRVGVNLSWLGSSHDPVAGHALTGALRAIATDAPSDLELVLFGLATLADEHADLVGAFETHTIPIPDRLGPVRLAAEQAWFPAAVGRHGIDLVHDAGGTCHGTVAVPRVLSIDDLAVLDRPRGVDLPRRLLRRRTLPRSVAAATRIVVPSRFVADRVVARLGADPESVDVVPWPLPPHPEAAVIETLRARHGIIGRIVLLPEATDAEQEHVVAVRAMQHLAERHKDTTMVIAGAAGDVEQQVLDEIDGRGLASRIVRMAPATGPLRSALFEQAVAVVDPSVYGGFASSALEAMAVGVPVVVADAGPAPEVVRGAGAVVPAGDDAQLAVELHRVLEDTEWRDRMVAEGYAVAARYTPQRTAEGLLAAYRAATVDL